MKIRIIRACGVRGQHVDGGTVLELPKQEALALVTLRRAVELGEEQPIEKAEPTVETRDPIIATETRKPGRKPKANG